MKMHDEKVTFNIFKEIKFIDDFNVNDYFSIDVIDDLVNNVHVDIYPNDAL